MLQSVKQKETVIITIIKIPHRDILSEISEGSKAPFVVAAAVSLYVACVRPLALR